MLFIERLQIIEVWLHPYLPQRSPYLRKLGLVSGLDQIEDGDVAVFVLAEDVRGVVRWEELEPWKEW
jgi:hypothetical protein